MKILKSSTYENLLGEISTLKWKLEYTQSDLEYQRQRVSDIEKEAKARMLLSFKSYLVWVAGDNEPYEIIGAIDYRWHDETNTVVFYDERNLVLAKFTKVRHIILTGEEPREGECDNN